MQFLLVSISGYIHTFACLHVIRSCADLPNKIPVYLYIRRVKSFWFDHSYLLESYLLFHTYLFILTFLLAVTIETITTLNIINMYSPTILGAPAYSCSAAKRVATVQFRTPFRYTSTGSFIILLKHQDGGEKWQWPW